MEDRHHAFFIETKAEHAEEILPQIETLFHFERTGNLDFFLLEKESFGIDDARRIKERAILRSFGEGKHHLMIFCRFLTREAQNSLLKLFEDPPQNTVLFLAGMERKTLLPTLSSRVTLLSLGEDSTDLSEAEKFLLLSRAERIRFLSQFQGGEEGEKMRFEKFLSSLELFFRKKLQEVPKDADRARKLTELLRLKNFVGARSASLKMIGEYLSLTL